MQFSTAGNGGRGAAYDANFILVGKHVHFGINIGAGFGNSGVQSNNGFCSTFGAHRIHAGEAKEAQHVLQIWHGVLHRGTSAFAEDTTAGLQYQSLVCGQQAFGVAVRTVAKGFAGDDDAVNPVFQARWNTEVVHWISDDEGAAPL